MTALAIETDNFCRDDIYTLFVTTRIVNFLKGLAMGESTSLVELLTRRWPEQRTRIGFAVLAELIDSGRLYYSTQHGLVENRKFNTDLFARILSQIGAVTCQDSGRVIVDEFAQKLLSPVVYSARGRVTRNMAPATLRSNETSPP